MKNENLWLTEIRCVRLTDRHCERVPHKYVGHLRGSCDTLAIHLQILAPIVGLASTCESLRETCEPPASEDLRVRACIKSNLRVLCMWYVHTILDSNMKLC
jgi:hypothetical protein